MQGPRQDSGSAGAKKFLDALEKGNILGKVRFQKKRVSVMCVCERGGEGGEHAPLSGELEFY